MFDASPSPNETPLVLALDAFLLVLWKQPIPNTAVCAKKQTNPQPTKLFRVASPNVNPDLVIVQRIIIPVAGVGKYLPIRLNTDYLTQAS